MYTHVYVLILASEKQGIDIAFNGFECDVRSNLHGTKSNYLKYRLLLIPKFQYYFMSKMITGLDQKKKTKHRLLHFDSWSSSQNVLDPGPAKSGTPCLSK